MNWFINLAVLILVKNVSSEANFLLQSNSKDHHTDKYKLSSKNLIVRRGQPFHVQFADIEVNDLATDINCVLKYVRTTNNGDQPMFNVPMAKEPTEDTNDFYAVTSSDSNLINVAIHTPVTASIGMYSIEFTVKEKFNETKIYSLDTIYLLFNPWHRDDQVYLPDEHARNEYVLNDIGKVYLGSSSYYSDKQWIFGQFEETILPAVMFLLDQNRFDLNHSLRSDVVGLSRVLSALVNANDGFGVIAGNWNPPYYGGENPASWSSSVDILERYHNSNGEAVRWGQCWVFAAVLTTVCRTLGIPARPITTFASAHDTDDSLTIDTFTDMNGEEMDIGGDSVWNFHAWTEAWLSRTDLATGHNLVAYDGSDVHPSSISEWQVIDSTPQELSDGIFQTGPGSVLAVKKGMVNLPYDLHFIFSEVSSATVHWREDPVVPLGWRKITTNTYQNGDLIVTKKIGNLTMDKDDQNITSSYKFDDGKERQFVLLNAAIKAGVDLLFLEKDVQVEHVKFNLVQINETTIGDNVTIRLQLENVINETTFVKSVIRVDSNYYNGITAARISKQESSLSLAPSEKVDIELIIPFTDYYDKLVEHNLLHIYIDAIVYIASSNHTDHSTDNPVIVSTSDKDQETQVDQFWTEEADFSFKIPKLSIELINLVENVAKFRIKYTNPLDIHLDNGVVTVKGMRKYIEFSVNTIKPKEEVSYEVVIKVEDDTTKLILFSLDTDQLSDVRGSIQLN